METCDIHIRTLVNKFGKCRLCDVENGKGQRPRWSLRAWTRWFIPLPLLLWYSRRNFDEHVWWQGANHQLELRRRFPNGKANNTANYHARLVESLRSMIAANSKVRVTAAPNAAVELVEAETRARSLLAEIEKEK